MKPRVLRRSIFIPFLAILSQQALAAEGSKAPLKEGEAVYKEVCSACHATGVAHAPKFQDREAWAPLLAEGQAVLTGHAWVGVRAMPARGGVPELRLGEFARAVAYMARNAGGDWNDPDAPMLRQIAGEAEKRLDVAIRESQAMKRELHRLHLQRK
jgi:cytochrome c5